MEESPDRTQDEQTEDDAESAQEEAAPAPARSDGEETPPAPGASATPADDRETAATVEAILFSTDTPISPAKVAQIGELPGRREVKQAVEALNRRYDEMGCAFRIESIAGGYQMLTRPEYHDVVSRLFKARSDTRLSQAAMEALAIIAYRQPVLRADVEAIRGVASGEVLRGLMEKQLVKIVGRAEVLGRPMLYGTTRRFLEVFGLSDLKDLPKVEELRSGAPEDRKGKSAPPAGTEAAASDAPPAGQMQTVQAEPAPPGPGPEAPAAPGPGPTAPPA